MRKDPQIVAEHEARERNALFGYPRTASQIAAAHRMSAAAERDNLLTLYARREAATTLAEHDRLTREINESQAFIARRKAKAKELEAISRQPIAAE